MIGTSIALALWTTGLLCVTMRAERNATLEDGSQSPGEANLEAGFRDVKA